MFIVVIVVLVVLVLLVIGLYNRLVKLRNNRENAFADIDVQLKQRLDLIPQLVEAVEPGDVIMVKGSLGSRMAPLVEALKRRFGAETVSV